MHHDYQGQNLSLLVETRRTSCRKISFNIATVCNGVYGTPLHIRYPITLRALQRLSLTIIPNEHHDLISYITHINIENCIPPNILAELSVSKRIYRGHPPWLLALYCPVNGSLFQNFLPLPSSHSIRCD